MRQFLYLVLKIFFELFYEVSCFQNKTILLVKFLLTQTIKQQYFILIILAYITIIVFLFQAFYYQIKNASFLGISIVKEAAKKPANSIFYTYLPSKLHQIGEILKTLGDHNKAPGGRRTRLFAHEPELPGIEQGGAQQAQEDETGDDARPHESLARPFGHDRLLQAAADVAHGSGTRVRWREYAQSHLERDGVELKVIVRVLPEAMLGNG